MQHIKAMQDIKAKHFFMVAGSAESNVSTLNAFDHALIRAGIGDTNLIRLSSIIPPEATRIDPISFIPKGAYLPVAYAAITTPPVDAGAIISAAVAVALPKNNAVFSSGLIMEYSGFCDEHTARINVEQMVREGYKIREIEVGELFVISSSCAITGSFGAAFAGVVLFNELQIFGYYSNQKLTTQWKETDKK